MAEILNPHIAASHIHFATHEVTADELRAEWQQLHTRFAMVIADADGDVAGFAKTSPWRTRAAYSWTAEVAVYVSAEHQRRGVARALYDALIRVSARQGYHVLIAGIALPNEPSVRLHEALGFARVGVFREVGHKHGKAIDVGFWERVLDGTAGARAPVQPAVYDEP